jgi:hypothetical protein
MPRRLPDCLRNKESKLRIATLTFKKHSTEGALQASRCMAGWLTMPLRPVVVSAYVGRCCKEVFPHSRNNFKERLYVYGYHA